MEIISGLGIGQWDERRRRRRRKSQMNLNLFAYQWRSVLGPLAFAIGKLIFLYIFFYLIIRRSKGQFLTNIIKIRRPIWTERKTTTKCLIFLGAKII